MSRTLARRCLLGLLLPALALLSTLGCNARSAHRTATLIPGVGLGQLKIGVTTIDEAFRVLGESKSLSTSSGTSVSHSAVTGAGPEKHWHAAFVRYPDIDLELVFRGESSAPGLTEEGQRARFQQFRDKQLGKLYSIEVKLGHDPKETSKRVRHFEGKTDQGIGLLSKKSEVDKIYGRPARVWYTQFTGNIGYYRQGLNITLKRLKPEEGGDAEEPVVVSISVRRPFSQEELDQVPRGSR